MVEPVGLSGGLALLWRDHHLLEIQNYTRRHINAIVTHNAVGESWKLTYFYRLSVVAKRHESWVLLEHLMQFQPSPWVCIGDFNEKLMQKEKTGAVLRKERQMDQFRGALENCNLRDLGFIGARYTWNNGRHDENFVSERLDWALANSQWKAIYHVVNVYALAGRASDHKPIFLQFGHEVDDTQEFHKSFKFEAKWQLDEEFTNVVKDAWSGGHVGATGIQTMKTN
jgi:endonuclease/exonuclease/phosphatase family metal-dependent hydrolase